MSPLAFLVGERHQSFVYHVGSPSRPLFQRWYVGHVSILLKLSFMCYAFCDFIYYFSVVLCELSL